MLQFLFLVAMLALGKLDTTSTSFTWLRRVMAFSGLLFEVEGGVSGLPIHLDDLWTYT